MKMENKTTKLQIVIHALYKRGYNYQKEKSAIIFFKNLQNWNNVEIRVLTRLLILLKME